MLEIFQSQQTLDIFDHPPFSEIQSIHTYIPYIVHTCIRLHSQYMHKQWHPKVTWACIGLHWRLLRTTTGFIIYLRHILMARLYQLTKLKFETIRRVWATCRMGNGVLAEASKTCVKQISFTRVFSRVFSSVIQPENVFYIADRGPWVCS